MSDLLLGYLNDKDSIAKGGEKYVIDERGDLQFDKNGQLILVSNSEKLRQNIGKILLTEQGKSDVAPEYGSTLPTFPGTPISPDPGFAIMKQTILDALGFYITQYLDSTNPDEKIETIETLSVKLDDTNSVIHIVLVITTESTKQISIEIILK
jgi:phage baseplate assembly protein W